MKKVNKKIEVVFLLDRSGSMRGSEENTINGFNTYLKEQQKNNANITTILFDDHYETLYFRKDIKDVKDLTKEEYYVRGCTALYDAIGLTIEKFDQEKVNNKVMIVITTDGLENASTKYNRTKILELIKGHPNYEFIYVGANIDSYSEASLIGIRKNNIANYEKSEKGIQTLYKSISKACDMFVEDEFCESWKDDLE